MTRYRLVVLACTAAMSLSCGTKQLGGSIPGDLVAASLPREMFEPTIPSTSRGISLDEINLARLLAR
jgi:hypothetical protein